MQTIEELEANDPLAGAIPENELSLAELASLNLGDVESVRFESLPTGIYIFEVKECSLTRKGDENVPVITVNSEVLEVDAMISVPEGKTEDSFVGKSHVDQFWLRSNDLDGIGRFRAFAQDVGLGECAAKLGEVLGALEGHRFKGQIRHRKSKHDPSVVFANLNPKGAIS